jgi:hypothetical protein
MTKEAKCCEDSQRVKVSRWGSLGYGEVFRACDVEYI